MGKKSQGRSIHKDPALIQHREIQAISSQKNRQNYNGTAETNADARGNATESIGTHLRQMRLKRDIGLDEVSEATGISTAVLRALEDEDMDNLPAEVYIRAFYKKYADFLGLDSDEIAAKYEEKARSLKRTGRRFSFSTVITIKGQDEDLFTDTLRRLFLPLALLILGLLLYWVYKNYLAPYNQIGFSREFFPSLFSSRFQDPFDLFRLC